ncbi:multicopper oxidase-domain-containing protein [Massariosphaeria phaeospora]|uniref:Multicopper oxidase-domain-containing protein n=1 Tax=Massariosphaeria phaeospora TaxID=100035 RepID=A0A7C8MQL2_9PLEO|nr:multicopper oxidase-domain-containing protein [Massariosphaeria phaeospora]
MDRVWACITYALSYFTFSPLDGFEQAPLIPSLPSSVHNTLQYPIFKPPGGQISPGPDAEFQCEYPSLIGWSNCTTAENRTCWLRNDATGEEYNLWTNYEDTNQTPFGIHRNYTLDITDEWINADGMNFTEAKLFNASYPGPWIEGCWGDNITVTINNKLKYNGTSIHWHGIRQWLTMHMDGVNGVTQCPIAPGDSFDYTFRAMQYGSAWYHSHYSVQYADGALGPLTLHGPTSQPYDEAKRPILMTDWGHNSAFDAMYNGLQYKSILLNGTGNVTRFTKGAPAPLKVPDPYTIHFEDHLVPTVGYQTRPKRYLLRVINTAFDSTFVFSIDNHRLTVVGADFVPIHGYTTESILVGIGQRYHVIVEANPEPPSEDGNYWIRTWKADCFGFNNTKHDNPGYEKAGILRYNTESKALPSTRQWKDVPLNCSDEPYDKLKPIIPWTVGEAANVPKGETGEKFSVTFGTASTMFPFAMFSMGGDDSSDEFVPLRVDYGNPTFMNLNATGRWNPQWVVIPENYTDTDWVYMVIKGKKVDGTNGAHPIHLHGHDFAILQQQENATFPAKLNLTTANPPRRDVVLLPTNGYVVIAFKTDNPGAWLVHCHIADHASMGLAMQILERQSAAVDIWPNVTDSQALRTAQKGCERWNTWWGNCTNWWPEDGKTPGSSCKIGEMGASPDSGI